ncbi:hypothetical protein CAEBREN_11338 [Caenorhabditis brenneri]|uniref:F-box domain-containing protein n=1 Tax=Caenorhabditis brenneri TaxID=135651 RepID=G0NC53_CAEBE|nr:hypothetical protein CAEBREN_11338 [Caenorhabditis brenneri]
MAETSDNNPIATMENMPPEMLDEILDKLEPIEKLICKRVCRKFYRSVNRLDPGFFKIHVFTRGIWFNGLQMIRYRNRGNNCVVKYAGKEKIIENSNYMDVMISDLFTVLTNQNLHLAELRLLCADPVFAKIHELVVRNELTNLRTEHLIITTDFMYPALTTIFNALNYNNLQLNYIAEHILEPNLQQLERSLREIIDLVPAGVNFNLGIPWLDTLPIGSFLKFKRIELRITSHSNLSGRNIGNIIQTLLTSNVLEYCFLSAKYDIDDVIEFLTDEAHLQENEDVFVVEIPDKNERYTVELFENEFEITRSGN